jgi:hypothetical protein
MKEILNKFLKLFLSCLFSCNFICSPGALAEFPQGDKPFKKNFQETSFLHSVCSDVYSNNEKKDNRYNWVVYHFLFLTDKNIHRLPDYGINYESISDNIRFNNFLQAHFATST